MDSEFTNKTFEYQLHFEFDRDQISLMFFHMIKHNRSRNKSFSA